MIPRPAPPRMLAPISTSSAGLANTERDLAEGLANGRRPRRRPMQIGNAAVGRGAGDQDADEHHGRGHRAELGVARGVEHPQRVGRVLPQVDRVEDDVDHRDRADGEEPAEGQQGGALVVVGRQLRRQRGGRDLVGSPPTPARRSAWPPRRPAAPRPSRPSRRMPQQIEDTAAAGTAEAYMKGWRRPQRRAQVVRPLADQRVQDHVGQQRHHDRHAHPDRGQADHLVEVELQDRAESTTRRRRRPPNPGRRSS